MTSRRFISKIGIMAALLLTAFSVAAPIASAHVYLNDGTMQVFSHIDPDDDPIIATPARFFLIFTDSANTFDPAKCGCVATISDNATGKVLTTQHLFQTVDPVNPTTALFSFTFKAKGVYDLKVTGTSGTKPFAVDRVIRVDREPVGGGFSLNTLGPSEKNLVAIAIFALGFLIVAGIFVWESLRARKRKVAGGGTTRGSIATAVIVLLAALSLGGTLFHAYADFYHDHSAINSSSDSQDKHPCCTIQPATVTASAAVPVIVAPLAVRTESAPVVARYRIRTHRINNNSPPRKTNFS